MTIKLGFFWFFDSVFINITTIIMRTVEKGEGWSIPPVLETLAINASFIAYLFILIISIWRLLSIVCGGDKVSTRHIKHYRYYSCCVVNIIPNFMYDPCIFALQ